MAIMQISNFVMAADWLGRIIEEDEENLESLNLERDDETDYQ
jgi:hypothetical protein